MEEIMSTSWEMINASSDLKCTIIPWYDILQEQFAKDCVDGRNQQWLYAALTTLDSNQIPLHEFTNSVKDLLK